MRQKYLISREGANHKLKIREYAVIDRDLKNASSSMLQPATYAYLCEETYDNEIIISSISKGMNALIGILRTHNIFPIEPYVTEIAKTVMALYQSPEDNSVELFFDDKDRVSV